MLTNDQSDECFLPAKNSHVRMRNKIKTNRDKSSICHMTYFYGKKLYILLALLYLSKAKNRISLPYSKKKLWPF